MLDDEVAESVFRSRGVSLDMDAVTLLNSDNFLPAVAEHSLTVALFYLKCETRQTTGHENPDIRCMKLNSFSGANFYKQIL